MSTQKEKIFPLLPYAEWQDTLDTLHMYMQIVGKVKLELCPFVNHWWHVALLVTPTGMTTGRIPFKDNAFEVDLNFRDHILTISTSRSETHTIELKPRSVADFYKEFMSALNKFGIDVSINTIPAEFAETIPFPKDTKHCSYDKSYVEKWWRIQLSLSMIFDKFRSTFRGKCSPIHFYWGSFDLSGVFYSGKKADPPKMDGVMGRIMEVAENEENFAFGFWAGDSRFPHPALYSYIYPAPKDLETINAGPDIAYFNKNLSECILPYDDLCRTSDPEKQVMKFLETTYKECAKLAGWDLDSLKC